MTTQPTDDCCQDYLRTSRRGLLRAPLAVAGAGLAVTFGDTLVQTAYAAAGPAEQVLVLFSMRGAADGLSLVVPHADPVYYQARPSIALAKPSLLVPDAMFGLHPELAPLVPMWNAGKIAAVQATGQAVTTRSHFAAMEEVEDADPGSKARVGWLNRLVGRNGPTTPLQMLQVGGGPPATQIVGPQPSLGFRRVRDVRLPGPGDDLARARRTALHTVWDSQRGPLARGVRSTMQATEDFGPVTATPEKPFNGAVYPNGSLGEAMASAARTIRGDVGAEVITIDHGSWDHHQWAAGGVRSMASEFAAAVAAFFADLGSLADKVTLVTISEFGRRVVENATGGLDHGHGNVMFVMGAGVKGGYYGRWPGLSLGGDADLSVTTDYRSVLYEAVGARFNVSPGVVFPGFAPQSLGIVSRPT